MEKTKAFVLKGILFLSAGFLLGQRPVTAKPEDGDETSLEQVLERGAARIEAGDFHATLHARIQAWGGYVGDDALRSNGDPMQQPGFRLRRARLGVGGGFSDFLSYHLELDVFDQERTGGPLYLAWVKYRPVKYLGFRAGFQKFPFSYGEIRSSARLAHMDRSLGTYAMAPSSTMGLTVEGQPWPGHLYLTAGVFNGLQRKPGFHEGYEGIGVTEGNKFEKLSYVGRLDIEPFGDVGPDEGDLLGLREVRLAAGGAFFYNDGRSVRILGASGYLHLKAYGAHLLGEVLWDRAEPQKEPTSSTNTVPTKVSRLSAQGSIGYIWKKWGLAVRGEYLNDNLDIKSEGDEVAIAGTFTYYIVKNFFKAQVEYQHRVELHGRALKNDAVLAGIQCYF